MPATATAELAYDDNGEPRVGVGALLRQSLMAPQDARQLAADMRRALHATPAAENPLEQVALADELERVADEVDAAVVAREEAAAEAVRVADEPPVPEPEVPSVPEVAPEAQRSWRDRLRGPRGER